MTNMMGQVREVLFINEVDAQNRKLSLEQRMEESEQRRQEQVDAAVRCPSPLRACALRGLSCWHGGRVATV